MTSLRRYALAAVVLLCSSLVHAQSDAPNVKTIHPMFTTIDVPGAGVTVVYGINSAGDMVGYYGATTSDPHKHGFLLRDGAFTFLDYPGATSTFAYAVTDTGVVIGSAEFNGGLTAVGFIYDGTTYTPFQVSGQGTTIPYAINSRGDIVGGAGGPYTTKGFELRGTKSRVLPVPGSYGYVFASGINKARTVVGWADEDAFVCHNLSCQIVNYPEANQTANRGINDQGIIVGWYFLSGTAYAFAWRKGAYLPFTYPGADTYATGINTSGAVVGGYTFDYQAWHGFVTSSITAADLW